MPFSPVGEDLEVSEISNVSGGGDGLSGSGGEDPDPQYPDTSGVQELDEVNLGVVRKKEHSLMGNENSGRSNIFTWGNGIEDNGRHGRANGELNVNDLPILMGGKTGNVLMDFLKDLLELIDWNDRAQKALKSNESTMENKDVEPGDPPKSKVKLKDFNTTQPIGFNKAVVLKQNSRDTLVEEKNIKTIKESRRQDSLKAYQLRDKRNSGI